MLHQPFHVPGKQTVPNPAAQSDAADAAAGAALIHQRTATDGSDDKAPVFDKRFDSSCFVSFLFAIRSHCESAKNRICIACSYYTI